MLTAEQYIGKMLERGYSRGSSIESGGELKAINFIKHVTDQIEILAKVTLRSESVSLYYVGLKYFCQLSAEDFQFDHPDFEKYEQIITMYAAKCLEIDVFATLDSLKGTIPEPVKEVKKSIEERKLAFQNEIKKYISDTFPKDEAKKFFYYWTEMGPKDKRFRRELETKFDIKRRITTWLSNNKKWEPAWKEKQKQKVEKDTKAILEVKPTIKHEGLF